MLRVFLLIAWAADASTELPKLGEPVGDMPNWFNSSDWTSSRAGGAVRFKVIFNQAGIPDTCAIQATTGNKEVEALACAIVMKRFRFKPSSDVDGSSVNRVLIRSIAMAQQMPEPIRSPALFSLTVKGYKNVPRLSLVADVDKDGTLVGCAGNEKKETLIALSTAACRSIKSLWQPLLEVDSAGNAIRYVRDVAVDLENAPD